MFKVAPSCHDYQFITELLPQYKITGIIITDIIYIQIYTDII